MIFAAGIIVFVLEGDGGKAGSKRLVLKISHFKKCLFLKLAFLDGQRSDQTGQGMLALNHRYLFAF